MYHVLVHKMRMLIDQQHQVEAWVSCPNNSQILWDTDLWSDVAGNSGHGIMKNGDGSGIGRFTKLADWLVDHDCW